MTIYRNLTQNITKGQKRVQKGSKKGKKKVKIKNAHRNTKNARNIPKMILHPNYDNYECNFLHIYIIYIGVYDNLYEFNLKYNKRSKKG